MLTIKSAEFVKSVASPEGLPTDGFAEFAFIGRSNVGKSSLMNMLFNRRNFVKTSKKPGKTVLLNYFSVNNSFYCVDLPGYGFAQRSAAEQQLWQRLIERYLTTRSELAEIFLLLDSRLPRQANDTQMMDFLDFHGIHYTPVFTKIDKLSKNELSVLKQKNPGVLTVSAVTGAGRDEILQHIENRLVLSE